MQSTDDSYCFDLCRLSFTGRAYYGDIDNIGYIGYIGYSGSKPRLFVTATQGAKWIPLLCAFTDETKARQPRCPSNIIFQFGCLGSLTYSTSQP